MRKLTRKYYLKIRIYVIILLSIVIGFTASVCLDEYGKLIDAYNESMEIWNDYNMRKNLGVSVKAEACETPRVEEEASLPSPDVESQIRAVFSECPDVAVAIAKCESQLQPDKIGDTDMALWSYGLFQINQTWHDYPSDVLLDADENIKIAKQIYDKWGWQRWTCARILGI